MSGKIESVIALNNEAIMLLKSGDDQQAVNLLTQLLVNLKSVLAAPSTASPNNNNTDNNNSHSNSSNGGCTPSMWESMGRMNHEAEELSQLPARCNFIYNKVFKLSPQIASFSGYHNVGDYNQVFAACIIYNLAVIHHHRGVLGDAVCTEKAARLYQMCIKIISSGAFDHFGTVRMLKAVAFNNLAQIYFDQSEFVEARACLVNLGNILSSADLSDALSAEEYDGIIANVLLLQPPTVAAAA